MVDVKPRPKKRTVPKPTSVKPRPKKTATRTTKPAAPSTPAKADGARATKKAAPATKTASKRAAAKKTTKAPAKERAYTRELNLHGFVPGSDTAHIVDALLEGGADRHDVTAKAIDRIEKTNGIETRGGNTKNVPSLISGLLTRLEAKGYTVESTWRLVPPADVAADMKKAAASEKRAATRRAKK